MRAPRFKGNVIIWNLPPEFTASDVAALFDDYGLVLGATVKRWDDAPDRGPRGLVDLAPEPAVRRAIEALDGSTVGTRKIKVRRVQEAVKPPASPRPVARPAPQTRPVVVERKSSVERKLVLADRKLAAERNGPIVEYRTPRRGVLTLRSGSAARP